LVGHLTDDKRSLSDDFFDQVSGSGLIKVARQNVFEMVPQAAKRLMRASDTAVAETLEISSVETQFLVYEHEGRDFAIHVEKGDLLQLPILSFLAIGIDLSVLNAISTVIDTPNLTLTEQLSDLSPQVDEQQKSVSIPPDGSFLGLISYKRLRHQVVKL
jgi:hypothetical protein